jgi:hypothetical protein
LGLEKGEDFMSGSIIKNKNFLAISSQVDLLKIVREKVMSAGPECSLDMATTLENGRQLMIMFSYNLVILDMTNILWRNLISLSASRNFPVLALSNINTSDEAINQSNEFNDMIIRTTLPRNNLNKIVPTIEEVLKCESRSGLRLNLEKSWRFLMNFGARPPKKYSSENREQYMSILDGKKRGFTEHAMKF